MRYQQKYIIDEIYSYQRNWRFYWWNISLQRNKWFQRIYMNELQKELYDNNFLSNLLKIQINRYDVEFEYDIE